MQSAIPIFNSFNTFLQETELHIRVLHQSTFHLYHSLLSRFVLPNVMADVINDLDSIDIYDVENLKKLNNNYIGLMTKQFLSEARKFFQRYVTYVRKSMPLLKDDVINSLTFISVTDCQKVTLEELNILVTRFITVIPQEDITPFETEFLEYQCTSEKELLSYLNESKTLSRIDFIWNGIPKISEPCPGWPKCKHVPKISVINTTFKCVL